MLTTREQKNASAAGEAPSVKPVGSHITGRTLALGVSSSRNASPPMLGAFLGCTLQLLEEEEGLEEGLV